MKKRIDRFLRGMLCLVCGGPEAKRDNGTPAWPVGREDRRPMTEEICGGPKAKWTLSEGQCVRFIEAVGEILKEEAAKKGMQVHIHVVPNTSIKNQDASMPPFRMDKVSRSKLASR